MTDELPPDLPPELDRRSPPPAYPWWQSRITMGIVGAIVVDLVHLFKLGNILDKDQVSALSDLLLQIGGLASLAWALRGRITQKGAAPVTLTKAKAAAINNGSGKTPPPEPPL